MQAYSVVFCSQLHLIWLASRRYQGICNYRVTKAEVEEHPSLQMKVKVDGGEQIIPSCTDATFLTQLKVDSLVNNTPRTQMQASSDQASTFLSTTRIN